MLGRLVGSLRGCKLVGMLERAVSDVLAGTSARCGFRAGRLLDDSTLPARLIFPGSFNPLHDGHKAMVEYALRQFGDAVDFELSVSNVDKSTLDASEIMRRLNQFGDHRVWLTQAPTFAEKAQLFPGASFLLGADTATRLFASRYYDSPQTMLESMSRFDDVQCRFVVFGRKIDGEFADAESLQLPTQVRHLFDLIPQSSFRMDISSTEIRGKRHI